MNVYIQQIIYYLQCAVTIWNFNENYVFHLEREFIFEIFLCSQTYGESVNDTKILESVGLSESRRASFRMKRFRSHSKRKFNFHRTFHHLSWSEIDRTPPAKPNQLHRCHIFRTINPLQINGFWQSLRSLRAFKWIEKLIENLTLNLSK